MLTIIVTYIICEEVYPHIKSGPFGENFCKAYYFCLCYETKNLRKIFQSGYAIKWNELKLIEFRDLGIRKWRRILFPSVFIWLWINILGKKGCKLFRPVLIFWWHKDATATCWPIFKGDHYRSIFFKNLIRGEPSLSRLTSNLSGRAQW